jgi:hypothetical protein
MSRQKPLPPLDDIQAQLSMPLNNLKQTGQGNREYIEMILR